MSCCPVCGDDDPQFDGKCDTEGYEFFSCSCGAHWSYFPGTDEVFDIDMDIPEDPRELR